MGREPAALFMPASRSGHTFVERKREAKKGRKERNRRHTFYLDKGTLWEASGNTTWNGEALSSIKKKG